MQLFAAYSFAAHDYVHGGHPGSGSGYLRRLALPVKCPVIPVARRPAGVHIAAMSFRSDPKVHARFLAYKERHQYFGRGPLREALTYEQFGELEAERQKLRNEPGNETSARRLAELSILLLDD